jgi:hypothetical protein
MKRAAVNKSESRPRVIFQSANAERGRRSSPSQRRSGNEHSRSIWNGAKFTVAS